MIKIKRMRKMGSNLNILGPLTKQEETKIAMALESVLLSRFNVESDIEVE